jgi:uncharacterized protein YjdB
MTISGQIIPVTNITVTGEGGLSTINSASGTLQLNAEVLPVNASNQSLSWSVASLTGAASISADGLVTALELGTVTAQASANDGSGVFGILNISIHDSSLKSYSVIVTSDEIKIVFYDDNYISWAADLYTLQGTHIIRKFVDSDIVEFNSSHVPAGLYILVLSKGDKLAVEKVMVP